MRKEYVVCHVVCHDHYYVIIQRVLHACPSQGDVRSRASKLEYRSLRQTPRCKTQQVHNIVTSITALVIPSSGPTESFADGLSFQNESNTVELQVSDTCTASPTIATYIHPMLWWENRCNGKTEELNRADLKRERWEEGQYIRTDFCLSSRLDSNT